MLLLLVLLGRLNSNHGGSCMGVLHGLQVERLRYVPVVLHEARDPPHRSRLGDVYPSRQLLHALELHAPAWFVLGAGRVTSQHDPISRCRLPMQSCRL